MSASLRSTCLLLVATLALGTASAHAALYTETFDTAASASGWTVNASAGDNLADFGFNYSSVGIPAAPNSTGGSGDTFGLKLQSNRQGIVSPAAAYTGLSVSPNGQTFSGDYRLRADVWLNFNVPNGSGSGTTQYAGMGLLTNGTSPQWTGTSFTGPPAATSIYAQVTVDGGNGPTSNSDYRVVSPAVAGYGDAEMAANGTGFRDNVNAFYTGAFPSVTLAAGNPQAAAGFPLQVGSTPAGTVAFAWHDWSLTKIGTTMTWAIDGITIATIDLTTAGTTSGTNFLLNYSDSNSGRSADTTSPALLFGLYDNVRVEAIPEVSSVLFGGVATVLGGVGAWFSRRKA